LTKKALDDECESFLICSWKSKRKLQRENTPENNKVDGLGSIPQRNRDFDANIARPWF
jgi:hypothetical protein